MAKKVPQARCTQPGTVIPCGVYDYYCEYYLQDNYWWPVGGAAGSGYCTDHPSNSDVDKKLDDATGDDRGFGVYQCICPWDVPGFAFDENGSARIVESDLGAPPTSHMTVKAGAKQKTAKTKIATSKAMKAKPGKAIPPPSSQGTYRLWKGSFYLVSATCQNNGYCPADLIAYSVAHPNESILVQVDFGPQHSINECRKPGKKHKPSHK